MYKVLITGGAGFIGSHVAIHFVQEYPQYQIYNLDKLTYAGNLENVKEIEGAPNYHFICADLNSLATVRELFETYQFNAVIHLAAESHVDRSIEDPLEFVRTNVLGTVHLLEASLGVCEKFYHISTDEVYGTLGSEGYFTEESPYKPSSPYSATKAASDHLVRAYGHTFGLPYIVSNCSNNFGPHQYPEKLIPLAISRFLARKPVPVYGDGSNVRDWLYVKDHVEAIDLIFHRGKLGETYNVGGECEKRNIDLILELSDLIDAELGRPLGESRQYIHFVKDRPGHDQRYAIDCSKIKKLGWKRNYPFGQALQETLAWYTAKELLAV